MHLVFAKPWSKVPAYSYFQPSGSGVAKYTSKTFSERLCQMAVALAVSKKMPPLHQQQHYVTAF